MNGHVPGAVVTIEHAKGPQESDYRRFGLWETCRSEPDHIRADVPVDQGHKVSLSVRFNPEVGQVDQLSIDAQPGDTVAGISVPSVRLPALNGKVGTHLADAVVRAGAERAETAHAELRQLVDDILYRQPIRELGFCLPVVEARIAQGLAPEVARELWAMKEVPSPVARALIRAVDGTRSKIDIARISDGLRDSVHRFDPVERHTLVHKLLTTLSTNNHNKLLSKLCHSTCPLESGAEAAKPFLAFAQGLGPRIGAVLVRDLVQQEGQRFKRHLAHICDHIDVFSEVGAAGTVAALFDHFIAVSRAGEVTKLLPFFAGENGLNRDFRRDLGPDRALRLLRLAPKASIYDVIDSLEGFPGTDSGAVVDALIERGLYEELSEYVYLASKLTEGAALQAVRHGAGKNVVARHARKLPSRVQSTVLHELFDQGEFELFLQMSGQVSEGVRSSVEHALHAASFQDLIGLASPRLFARYAQIHDHQGGRAAEEFAREVAGIEQEILSGGASSEQSLQHPFYWDVAGALYRVGDLAELGFSRFQDRSSDLADLEYEPSRTISVSCGGRDYSLQVMITKNAASGLARASLELACAQDNPDPEYPNFPCQWNLPSFAQMVVFDPVKRQVVGVNLLHRIDSDTTPIIVTSFHIDPSATESISADSYFEGTMNVLEDLARRNGHLLGVDTRPEVRFTPYWRGFDQLIEQRIVNVSEGVNLSSGIVYSFRPLVLIRELDLLWRP